jgi:hypothetical protein
MTPILNAIQHATAQLPVSIEQLRKIAEREEIDVVALYTLLDELHIARKVGRISGIRDGKPVLAYWPLVELIPAAAGTPAAPPRVHQLPPEPKAKQHKNNWPNRPKPAAAPPAKEPTMKTKPAKQPPVATTRQQIIAALRTALLQYITEHPGPTGKEITQWATTNVPGASRNQIKYATQWLVEQQKITASGKTCNTRYFAAGAIAAASKPAKAKQPIAKPSASAELESATKAAQCADLLVSDMEALNKTRNPLVRELLDNLLPDANQLKNKLARIAGHIQKLHSQGDQP